MKLFGIDIKPELNKLLYWIHIIILALLVQIILGQFGHDVGNLFSLHTLHFAVAIVLADIIAHTLLKLD